MEPADHGSRSRRAADHCRVPDFGDILDVKAFTSKNDASVYFAAISSTAASDADAIQDIASDRYGTGFSMLVFRSKSTMRPRPSEMTRWARLTTPAPDGSVVVAHLVLDKLNAPAVAR
jgi:hypothetical protein